MSSYTRRTPAVSSSKRKYFLAAVVIAVLIAGLVVFLEKTNRLNIINNPPLITDGTTEDIDFSPPTKEDAEAVDETKENIIKQQGAGNQNPSPAPSDSTTTSDKKAVKPIIGSVSQTDVRSFVPGIIENGGTCTATFSKTGYAQVTRTSNAIANAQNTTCAVNYESSGVGSGWKVTVTYQSATSEGTSDATTIQ